MRKKKKWNRVDWREAPEIKLRVNKLIKSLQLDWLPTNRIFCMRSSNSSSRAYARIWGLSRVWQMALEIKPAYIIEVLSNKFDKLSKKEQDKVLLHELVHIPKNFSGSLMPHVRRKGERNFEKRVRELFHIYLKYAE